MSATSHTVPEAKPLTARERAELDRLSRKWATGRATVREMDRHRSLLHRASLGARS